MKQFIFLLVAMLSLSSCRNDDAVQKIDQITALYIDSAGIDMFNSKILGSYSSVSLNDVYGLTDSSPVPFTLKKDVDTLNYLEYMAGARRIGIDSSDMNAKIYQSKIALNLNRKLNDSTNVLTTDTLTINYVYRPDLFSIQSAWYNKDLVFTKIAGQPNVIKISK